MQYNHISVTGPIQAVTLHGHLSYLRSIASFSFNRTIHSSSLITLSRPSSNQTHLSILLAYSLPPDIYADFRCYASCHFFSSEFAVSHIC